MDITTFARLHGVLIDRLVEDGRWHRVPTESHPRKKNGAYMSRGVYGFVQDHAAHPEAIMWKPEDDEIRHIDRAAIEANVREAQRRIAEDQAKAAKHAAWVLGQSEQAGHPYLVSKGFVDARGHVWRDEKAGDIKLCLPMRVDGRLVGLQTISNQPAHERIDRNGELVKVPAFEKRFLYGQRTDCACYLIDNSGQRADAPTLFCEGYATGLSVAAAMHTLKQRFRLIITFTAGNLAKVAANHGRGYVVADYDLPSKGHPQAGGHGVAVAKATGLPFWQSDREGEDANDFHQRVGLLRFSQSLKSVVFIRKAA